MPPKNSKKKASDEPEIQSRIAIVSTERCRPKKCNQECKKSCPVVKLGKLCIEVGPKSTIAFLSEPLCIGKWTRRERHDGKNEISNLATN
jgi:ATP-binding cassette, sub-family E, member 1